MKSNKKCKIKVTKILINILKSKKYKYFKNLEKMTNINHQNIRQLMKLNKILTNFKVEIFQFINMINKIQIINYLILFKKNQILIIKIMFIF